MSSYKNFVASVKESGMIFALPQQSLYKSVPIQDNEQVAYELAIRSINLNLQIRYVIATNRAITTKPQAATMYFVATVTNISNSGDPNDALTDSREFNQADVRSEFNADWGAPAAVTPTPEFAANFNQCFIVNIYKRGRGSAFII